MKRRAQFEEIEGEQLFLKVPLELWSTHLVPPRDSVVQQEFFYLTIKKLDSLSRRTTWLSLLLTSSTLRRYFLFLFDFFEPARAYLPLFEGYYITPGIDWIQYLIKVKGNKIVRYSKYDTTIWKQKGYWELVKTDRRNSFLVEMSINLIVSSCNNGSYVDLPGCYKFPLIQYEFQRYTKKYLFRNIHTESTLRVVDESQFRRELQRPKEVPTNWNFNNNPYNQLDLSDDESFEEAEPFPL